MDIKIDDTVLVRAKVVELIINKSGQSYKVVIDNPNAGIWDEVKVELNAIKEVVDVGITS